MQILLNTEAHATDHQSLATYLDAAANEALGHFGTRIVRIDAHLADENGPGKPDAEGIHCTLDAQLAGLGPVVVKERATTARQAIHGAIGKLERAVTRSVERHDHRGRTPSSATEAIDPGSDAVA